MNTDLTERIEYELDKKGLYRIDLTRGINVAESNFRNWKKGVMPAADVLYRVAQFLDVSVEYLLTGKHPMKNDTLSPDELAIIDYYRLLPEHDKATLMTLAKTLLKNSVNNNVTKKENN